MNYKLYMVDDLLQKQEWFLLLVNELNQQQKSTGVSFSPGWVAGAAQAKKNSTTAVKIWAALCDEEAAAYLVDLELIADETEVADFVNMFRNAEFSWAKRAIQQYDFDCSQNRLTEKLYSEPRYTILCSFPSRCEVQGQANNDRFNACPQRRRYCY